MAKLLSTANTKIFIGPVKENPGRAMTAADFAANTAWTRIVGTTNLGIVGDAAELIASNQIDSGDGNESRTRKAKGPKNAGALELVCDNDLTNPGQIALVAAEKTSDCYAFKIEFNDAPQGGKGSTRLFIGLVMSATEQFDEATSVMKRNATIEIDSNIVAVPAAAA